MPSATKMHHLQHSKGKGHPMQTQTGGREKAPTYLQPGTRRKWVVSTTPQQLYPIEVPVATVEDALSMVSLQMFQ
jgi:hypothetical protein